MIYIVPVKHDASSSLLFREIITSVSNARVKRLVRWRDKPRDRQAEGVLLSEGLREVQRALGAGLVLREWFVCEALLGDTAMRSLREPLSGRASLGVGISEPVMRKIAFHAKPEGVLAVFEAPRWTLDEIETRAKHSPLYLVVVDTEKPGNLGAMVRSASAAGAGAVLAVGPTVDAFSPQAIRNSTGAVFSLPVVQINDPAEAVAWLKSRGIRIVAALSSSGLSPEAIDLTQPTAIVIGPEHAGLPPEWNVWADFPVTIPMPGSAQPGGLVDSLNASVSAAVLLFEAARQRRSKEL
jgi:TrmH family RNA methyltransferase